MSVTLGQASSRGEVTCLMYSLHLSSTGVVLVLHHAKSGNATFQASGSVRWGVDGRHIEPRLFLGILHI